MTLDNLPPLLTLAQAAEFLHLDLDAVLDGIVAGELATVSVAGVTYLDTARLLFELGVILPPARAGYAEPGATSLSATPPEGEIQ